MDGRLKQVHAREILHCLKNVRLEFRKNFINFINYQDHLKDQT